MSLEQEIENMQSIIQEQDASQVQDAVEVRGPSSTLVQDEVQVQSISQVQSDSQEQESVERESSSLFDNYISNITNNNGNDSMLLINNDDDIITILKTKLDSSQYIEVEFTSESLFECLITEKSAPLLLITDFDPDSNSDNENKKSVNILKQLLSYGQSIICISDDRSFFTENNTSIRLF